jgi:hypothetical protein
MAACCSLKKRLLIRMVCSQSAIRVMALTSGNSSYMAAGMGAGVQVCLMTVFPIRASTATR